MASKRLLAILWLLLLLFFPTAECYQSRIIESICGHLPHRKECEVLLSQSPSNNDVYLLHHTFEVLLQLAEDLTLQTGNYTSSLGSKCKFQRERTALNDCIELYKQSFHRLKKLHSSLGIDPAEQQIWLSAALANLETCRYGFEDLGVTGNVYSMLSNNASHMISNCLALNKAPPTKPKTVNGFPHWVKPGERKLLQDSVTPHVVVAQDGSGNYRTVSQAVAAASGRSRFVIHVKAGIYKEIVQIRADNVMLIGDGIGKTIITGSRSVAGGATTFNSATVAITGDRFYARGITFRNTAGPDGFQAVALRSGSDCSVFYKCGFEGYQDTLYTHIQRQFYKDCDIYGTVDFIFGDAAVVFQTSNLYARNPPRRTNVITAHGRSDPNENTGYSIQNCNILAASGLSPHASTYLGRPWKKYSRTVFMQSNLGSLIHPAGWYPWDGNFALDTLYYAEYSNTGPGASTARRVKWKGYNVITSPIVATKFTARYFIGGDGWLPATGVPFTPGL